MFTQNFKFKDGVVARLREMKINYTYEGLIEGNYVDATEYKLKELEKQREEMEPNGGIYYCEPQLIDSYRIFDYDFEKRDYVKQYLGKCLKDCIVTASFEIIDLKENGGYVVTLVWYQSTKEFTHVPLLTLALNAVNQLSFADIKKYCKFYPLDYFE